jgi:hypothetical protein
LTQVLSRLESATMKTAATWGCVAINKHACNLGCRNLEVQAPKTQACTQTRANKSSAINTCQLLKPCHTPAAWGRAWLFLKCSLHLALVGGVAVRGSWPPEAPAGHLVFRVAACHQCQMATSRPVSSCSCSCWWPADMCGGTWMVQLQASLRTLVPSG